MANRPNGISILEDQTDIEVVGINDLTDPKTLAHLLEFDSVHGRFGKNVSAEDGAIIVGDRRVPTFARGIAEIARATLVLNWC